MRRLPRTSAAWRGRAARWPQGASPRYIGGCNTFAATAYPLRQQKFAVGPFALPTPRKSCEKAITDQENNFLIALRTSVEWDSVLGTLVVKTQNGELKFERSI